MRNNLRPLSCLVAVKVSVRPADLKDLEADFDLKVIVSSHNSLGDGRYYDVESSSSFVFDHSTQVCPNTAGKELEG